MRTLPIDGAAVEDVVAIALLSLLGGRLLMAETAASPFSDVGVSLSSESKSSSGGRLSSPDVPDVTTVVPTVEDAVIEVIKGDDEVEEEEKG